MSDLNEQDGMSMSYFSHGMTENSSFEDLPQMAASAELPPFITDTNEMFAWMICQLNEDNKPFNLLYGQFSTTIYPPKTGWVFLANNKEHNPERLPVSVFQQVKVSQRKAVDNSLEQHYNADTPIANRHASAPSRYYKVSGCPVPHVNGRYLNDGMYHQPRPTEDSLDITLGRAGTPHNSNAVIKYRNVRDYFILR